MESLRAKLPEGTTVEVVRSFHEWLSPGDRGVIHWNHARAVLPQLHIQRDGGLTSVQLVPRRDKVKIIEDGG